MPIPCPRPIEWESLYWSSVAFGFKNSTDDPDAH